MRSLPSPRCEAADLWGRAEPSESERIRKILERFRRPEGLGHCPCGHRAHVLFGDDADAPGCCRRCAAKVQADFDRQRRFDLTRLDSDAGRVRRLRMVQGDADANRVRLAAPRAGHAPTAATSRTRFIGYVAVFDSPYVLPDGTEEVVSYGAFRVSLRRGGLTLVNAHDDGRVVARQRDGSLRLREDHHGLFVEADLRASDEARGVSLLEARGELAGSWKGRAVREERSQPPLRRRILRQIDLMHVSLTPRTKAAYKQTWFVRDGVKARNRAQDCEACAVRQRLEEAALC